MTKEEFVAQVDRAAVTTEGLPVTSALLKHLSAQLRKGDPPWWKAALKAWEGRKFVAWSEAWGLFLTCVHFEALSDAESPLVPYFPSCGGTDEADPAGAFAAFLSDLPKSFVENLRSGYRRSYIEPRAMLWLTPALLYFQRRGLPYYVVEVNSGAGLNLVSDVVVPPKGFDSDLVAARIGLDPSPKLLEDIIHRRWITASIMPDQLQMIADLDKAAEKLLERKRRDATFVQLVECAPESAPKFVAQNIPADDPDVGLLFFNMGTTVRMTDADYDAYQDAVAGMMKPWGDRALWVEVENVRGELYSTTFQLRVSRMVDGQPRGHIMASFDFGAAKTGFDQEAALKFLGAK